MTKNNPNFIADLHDLEEEMKKLVDLPELERLQRLNELMRGILKKYKKLN